MKLLKVKRADTGLFMKLVGVKVKRADTGLFMKLVGVKVKRADAVKLKKSAYGVKYIVQSILPGFNYETRWVEFDDIRETEEEIRAISSPDFPCLSFSRGLSALSLKDVIDIQKNGENSKVFSTVRFSEKYKPILVASAASLVQDYKKAIGEIEARLTKDYESFKKKRKKENPGHMDITEPGEYKNVTGTLNVGGATADKIQDATFRVSANGYIVWENGKWNGGKWIDGIWKNGDFEAGWAGGWLGGNFNGGNFRGNFKGGNFNGGNFNGGTFHKEANWNGGNFNGGNLYGNFRGNFNGNTIYEGNFNGGTFNGKSFHGNFNSGIFKSGNFEEGNFNGGTFKGQEFGGWVKKAIFKNGTFESGIFEKNGDWMGGTWKGGTWKGGSIHGQPSQTPPEK